MEPAAVVTPPSALLTKHRLKNREKMPYARGLFFIGVAWPWDLGIQTIVCVDTVSGREVA